MKKLEVYLTSSNLEKRIVGTLAESRHRTATIVTACTVVTHHKVVIFWNFEFTFTGVFKL